MRKQKRMSRLIKWDRNSEQREELDRRIRFRQTFSTVYWKKSFGNQIRRKRGLRINGEQRSADDLFLISNNITELRKKWYANSKKKLSRQVQL